MTAELGDARGVLRTHAAVVTGNRRMTSYSGLAERRSNSTASRDVRHNCHTVDQRNSTQMLTSLPYYYY